MKTKFFTKNKNNKIEFTEEELKKLLDEMYNDGYWDGKNSHTYIYTTPYKSPWYYSTTTNTGYLSLCKNEYNTNITND